MGMTPTQQSQPSRLQKSGLFFISEYFSPDPHWDAIHYKPSRMSFPFFATEPLVLVLELTAPFLPQSRQLLAEMERLQLQTEVIFFSLEIPETELLQLFNLRRPFQMVATQQVSELQKVIQDAIEQGQQKKQQRVLVELFNEQNKELKKVSTALEERIEKRQEHLEEIKQKLTTTNEKNKFIQTGLFAIHNSTNLLDLEKNVSDLLQEHLQVDWFRILLSHSSIQSLNEKSSILSLYRFPLLQSNIEYGQLLFARSPQRPFRRDEKDLLEQMCGAISLCVERLLQIERNRDLQSQWESTFNAISDPVCLIDDAYNLLLANRRLLKEKGHHVLEKKCYQALFERTSPCPDCHRGKPFRLREQTNHSRVYDVFSQAVTIDYQNTFFHLYRDVSQQLGLERQLVESAKLAELGTISSSIAHELNNPLGGMINFIQLLLMDLGEKDPLRGDLLEMQTAALRCKDIVKNLLGFSRVNSESEKQTVLLKDVIQRAILITELKTRSMGVRIDFSHPPEDISVKARFNSLTQVFCNVLQNSYESILEKRKKNSSYSGCIQIRVTLSENSADVFIIDDGLGLPDTDWHHFFDPLFTTKDPEKHSGLGLTLARQILAEQSGHIHLTTNNESKTCAHIRLTRLSSADS